MCKRQGEATAMRVLQLLSRHRLSPHLHGSCARQEGPLEIIGQLKLLLNQLVPAYQAQLELTHIT
jgi:hypothetical protein